MQGFIYPNEVELQSGLLIFLYPYITGLVAGAFILASLERVFNVKEVEPTYRLALLTALAFLLVAPLPLLLHLGHPERFYEILFTPNLHSAIAMFGFVYAWYLMAVLLLEIWFDYRQDLILWARQERGLLRWVHLLLTFGATDLSERAVAFDRKAVRVIPILVIPSAFLLHGYVGFLFGSVKANPWWSSVLIPIVFLFSAIVSGIAMVMILYLITGLLRQTLDMDFSGKRALLSIPPELRRLLYLGAAVLIQIGIFSTRWNVVIGGQLFSKSLRGLTVYKVNLLGIEGMLVAGAIMLLPLVVLFVLIKILPPWQEAEVEVVAQAPG